MWNAAAQTQRQSDPEIRKDLKTLALFIKIYCANQHTVLPKSPVSLRTHDVAAIAGREVCLCPACAKLLAHAFVKRTHCPMDPKPACKHCPNHCYHPTYRQQIRQVMRYSGRKMLLGGRLDYLFHLLF
jgi:hypothetical protein